MTPSTLLQAQFETIDNYFIYLTKYGYMSDIRVYQILAVVLLIDSIEFFSDFVDDNYIASIENILRKADCCNCAINWNDYKSATTRPYYIFVNSEEEESSSE